MQKKKSSIPKRAPKRPITIKKLIGEFRRSLDILEKAEVKRRTKKPKK